MPVPLCNHCKHYRPKFPGWCARKYESYPNRAGDERAYSAYRINDRCGVGGWHFEPLETAREAAE